MPRDLPNITNGNPLRGIGQFGNYGESTFTRPDGTSGAPKGSSVYSGLQHDGRAGANASNVGEGFSFTVAADKSLRTLTLDTTDNAGTGLLTATPSERSAAPRSLSVDQTTSFNGSGIDTIQHDANSAGQTLFVSYVLTNDASPTGRQCRHPRGHAGRTGPVVRPRALDDHFLLDWRTDLHRLRPA